jgi:hypothetical protein
VNQTSDRSRAQPNNRMQMGVRYWFRGPFLRSGSLVIEGLLTNSQCRDLAVLILIHEKGDHPVCAALYQREGGSVLGSTLRYDAEGHRWGDDILTRRAGYVPVSSIVTAVLYHQISDRAFGGPAEHRSGTRDAHLDLPVTLGNVSGVTATGTCYEQR